MELQTDLHADDAPRGSVDEAEDSAASIDDEGYEEGGGFEDDMGDEAPGGADAAVLEEMDAAEPERQEAGGVPFDADRAWQAFADAAARALDAGSTGEFLARVLEAIARSARTTGRESAAAATLLAASLGTTATGKAGPERPQALFTAIAQWIADGLDDLEAFDAAASLFADQGVDEALVALTALGARVLAGDLSGGTRAPLDRSTGRALLHAVAAAVRELSSAGERRHVRTLPRLARSVARVIRRSGLTASQAARRIEHSLTEAARRISASPELAIRLASASEAPRRAQDAAPAPSAQTRRFTFTGPVTLTVSAR